VFSHVAGRISTSELEHHGLLVSIILERFEFLSSGDTSYVSSDKMDKAALSGFGLGSSAAAAQSASGPPGSGARPGSASASAAGVASPVGAGAGSAAGSAQASPQQQQQQQLQPTCLVNRVEPRMYLALVFLGLKKRNDLVVAEVTQIANRLRNAHVFAALKMPPSAAASPKRK
jgi:hypothetical protein